MGYVKVAIRQEAARLSGARESACSAWKRAFDVLAALVGLLILLPILIVAATLIKLESRGPVLFRQERIGRGGRSFTVLKLRTMHEGVSSRPHRDYIAAAARVAADAGLRKLTGDPRVTRVGRWLRRTSLDEVPQLLHVISGKMSIVGPRPAIAYELEHYEPRHFDRFEVRPGLTGLWQVSGRSDRSFDEMLDLDVEYVRVAGPRVDAQILLRTPLAVFRGRTA